MSMSAAATVAAQVRSARPASEPRVQYRTIHGYRRAFVCEGAGPALLLLHGIGDSSDSWSNVIPDLARDHMVIAPDLLGHGRSDKPRGDYSVAAYANAMRDLLTVLGIDRATVVGHSLGGGVALQFAYQYPERCERLVLVSTGGVSQEVNPVLRLAAAPLTDMLLPILAVPAVRSVGRIIMELLKHWDTDLGRDADDLIRVFDALPDDMSRTAFVRTLRAVVDSRGQVVTMLDRCYLARGVPTLLVWGQRDAVIPAEHAAIAHRALPGSRLEILSEAGHFPHHADAEHFLKVLREFLSSTEPIVHDAARWRDLLCAGPDAPPDPAAVAC